MGSQQEFQPLTREDRITVILYRTGIVLSAVILSGLAFLLMAASSGSGRGFTRPAADMLALSLYGSVGMSVFFIHLYVGAFKVYLKKLYYIGLACLVVLLYIGKGSLSGACIDEPYRVLFLLPLSGCLGFITAKEAFCFRLFEGYLLAMFMPVYLLLVSSGSLAFQGASYGLVLIALMLVVFTVRKTPMPLAWDIGDKTAYR